MNYAFPGPTATRCCSCYSLKGTAKSLALFRPPTKPQTYRPTLVQSSFRDDWFASATCVFVQRHLINSIVNINLSLVLNGPAGGMQYFHAADKCRDQRACVTPAVMRGVGHLLRKCRPIRDSNTIFCDLVIKGVFWTRRRFPKGYQRCCCSWGCCYQISKH